MIHDCLVYQLENLLYIYDNYAIFAPVEDPVFKIYACK